jgi:RNA polymerase sigma factor (TIGR02999 family)
MPDPEVGEVTALLQQMRQGVAGARDRLVEIVYRDLRAMAGRRVAGAAQPATLQPTALVHECLLRLMGRDEVPWNDRRHFFAAAARAMHDVMVEQARRRKALKRGGDRRRVPLEDAEASAQTHDEEVLAASDTLKQFQHQDPLAAEIIMLRVFGGLSHAETAKLLGLPLIRVRREWDYARAVLRERLERLREP